MSAVSPTDVWAVGDSFDANDTLILHWDGMNWSRVTSPNPNPDSNELYGVSAVSATDAWAVGEKGGLNHDTLVLHWDGNTWSEVMSPNPNPVRSGLSGVSADSARDAWAVGSWDKSGESEALILHWDGTRWSSMSPYTGSPSSELHGVSVVSPTDAWAVGNYYPDMLSAITHTLVLQWDGRRWSQVKSPNPGSDYNTLDDVSAVSPTDAWAVGIYRGRGGIGHTLVLHWDGRRWSQVKSPNPGSDFSALDSVSAVSPKDAWAAGYYQDQTGIGHTLVLHWDGRRWSQVESPNPGSHFNLLDSLSAVSPKDAWAVGDYQDKAGSRPLVLHWDGTNWSGADVHRVG